MNILLLTMDGFGRWVFALMWHVARVATLRPAFRSISDTSANLVSFLTVYLVAVYARLDATVGADATWELAIVSAVFHLMLLIAVSIQPGRSRSLFCVLLANSAWLDLARIFLASNFGIANSGSLVLILVEAVFAWGLFMSFKSQDPKVQAAGYIGERMQQEIQKS